MGEIQLAESTYVIKQAKFRHTVDEHGNPWFIVRDVCDFLEIKNVSTACERVWPENKDEVPGLDSIGRQQQMITVNEPGLYQLIFQSQKPEAVTFQRWVFNELLPSLRKHGYYRLPGRDMLSLNRGSATPTRHGRQPFLDVIRQRGITIGNAFDSMNGLEMPGVGFINTTYHDQVYGKGYVREPLARRSSAWLNLPIEDLFTESSRSRLPAGIA